jgi:hypothetical protein
VTSVSGVEVAVAGGSGAASTDKRRSDKEKNKKRRVRQRDVRDYLALKSWGT